MTIPSGSTPDPADLVRRIRARPASSWQHGSREADARCALQQLADIGADAAGEMRRSVPDVGCWAIADQLAVLESDAVQAGAPDATIAAVLRELAVALAIR